MWSISQTLKKNLTKAVEDAGEDEDLKTTIKSWKFHSEQLKTKLDAHCKKWPDSKHCKEKSEGK